MSFLALAPAAISAGGSILGGLLGSSAQQQQQKLQAAIAARQFAEQDQSRAISLAGQTDAEGNQVVFDPTTNTWQTILTAPQKQLQTASDRENLLRTTHDAGIQRQQLDANFARQQKEGGMADSYLADLQHRLQQPSMQNSDAAALRLVHNRDTLDAQNAALRGFETQGLRSGNGNVLDAIDRSRAETGGMLAHNDASALASAGSAAPDPYSKTGPLTDLYNAFASRASANPGGSGAAPFSGGSALTAALSNSARNSVLAGSGAGQVGNGYLASLRPDNSAAFGALGLSNGIAGFLKDPNVSKYLSGLLGNSSSDPNAGFTPSFASSYSDGFGM